MASLLLAVIPSEFGWMPTDLAGILVKNPFDWVQITSVLINPEICLSIHRVEQLFNLVDLVLDTKNKKHPVYAWEPYSRPIELCRRVAASQHPRTA
jgi:hypothetical protein